MHTSGLGCPDVCQV